MGNDRLQIKWSKISLQFFDSQTWRYPFQTPMIVKSNLLNIWCLYSEKSKSLKYISTEDTCSLLLHNACVGVIQNHYLFNFSISKLIIQKHCFEGSHLFSHQTFFNWIYLVLVLGIQRCTILKKQKCKLFMIKNQSKVERGFQIVASWIYICAIFDEKFSHFLLLIADCISKSMQ